MNVNIVKGDMLKHPRECRTGDVFKLMIDSKVIHEEEIVGLKMITCWALVSNADMLGYMIGGPLLEKELRAGGFIG